MQSDDEVAIVTGGTGSGRAAAERFVADGAYVCITARPGEVGRIDGEETSWPRWRGAA